MYKELVRVGIYKTLQEWVISSFRCELKQPHLKNHFKIILRSFVNILPLLKNLTLPIAALPLMLSCKHFSFDLSCLNFHLNDYVTVKKLEECISNSIARETFDF